MPAIRSTCVTAHDSRVKRNMAELSSIMAIVGELIRRPKPENMHLVHVATKLRRNDGRDRTCTSKTLIGPDTKLLEVGKNVGVGVKDTAH